MRGWGEASKSRGEIYQKPGQRLETKEENEGKSRKVEMKRGKKKAGRSESRLGLVIVGEGEGGRLGTKSVSGFVRFICFVRVSVPTYLIDISSLL